MSELRIFVFIFVIYLATLFGDEYLYIKIGETNNKNDIKEIGKTFRSLGISGLYKFDGLEYKLFSGPYADRDFAIYALNKLNKYFPSAYIVRREKSVTTQSKVAKKPQSEKSQGKFFMAFNISYNNILSSHKVESGSVLTTLPKEGSLGYNIDIGYRLSDQFSLSLGTQQILNDDISMYNQYLSARYIFSGSKIFQPYFDFLIGTSYSKWNFSPLENIIYIDDESSSMITGLGSGIRYKLNSYFIFTLGYEMLVLNHVAILKSDTGTSEVHFKRLDNIIIGVEYQF